jgi:hypothetical protein
MEKMMLSVREMMLMQAQYLSQIRTRPRAEDRNHKKSTRHNTLESEEIAWLKYLSLLGLLLTTVVSTSVLVGLEKGWKITGQTTYHAITSSRATTQFIVSIFSNFLGGIFVAVFCQLVNRATRLALSRPTSLDSLAFWHALSTKSLDLHLRWSFLPFLVAFYLASAGYVWWFFLHVWKPKSRLASLNGLQSFAIVKYIAASANQVQ